VLSAEGPFLKAISKAFPTSSPTLVTQSFFLEFNFNSS
jgi:hypothetical protein